MPSPSCFFGAAFPRLSLLLLACAGRLAAAAEFNDELHFVDAVRMDDVTKELTSSGKPGLVIVTQPWCGACSKLKKSVNSNPDFLELAEKFVLVHVSGDAGDEWQAPGEEEDYIPRVYFLTPEGKMLADIVGPNDDYKRFLSSSKTVVKGMNIALETMAGEL
eukprot:TRINITY_DN36793_c0_g1_i1.p2 TRINITY_DN36793_c0_g1~~TRINITY_DN36793_c0_g1_i1.p2  ORF type:complete len:162 (-),score=54.51 TRINITY_DN36793_c0_g1_i1:352-837(-)